MKTPRKYRVGDIISGVYLRENGDNVIGLITEVENGNANYPTYFVSVLWANLNGEEMTYLNENIDNWIEAHDVKHYQVIE